MTRHPKKKENEEKPTPSDSNLKDSSPSESSGTETEGMPKNPIGTLFWLRVGLGILAGIIAAILGGPIDSIYRSYVGFGIMIILFIVSYVIAKVMRIPLPSSDKKKLITTGIGSYFFIFIFSWILMNTLIHPAVTGLPIK